MQVADIKNFGEYIAEIKLYQGITAKAYSKGIGSNKMAEERLIYDLDGGRLPYSVEAKQAVLGSVIIVLSA